MSEKPLYQRIAEELVEQIETGVYPPGSRLPAERDLAERFSVSRVTIREAEIALQAVGRVSIKPGSGVYVSDTSMPNESDFPRVSAFEVTEARAVFESEAAALAAAQISEVGIATLERLVSTMAQAELGNAASEAADREFHRTIAAASNNAAVMYVIEKLWQMRDEIESVKGVHDAVCTTDPSARSQEHADILNAIKARDSGAARHAMRAHFHRLLESMIDATHEQAIRALQRQVTENRNRYLKSPGLEVAD